MITVQGVQIPIIERGEHRPTLFLHGVPDSGEMWDPIMQRMEHGFHCIAPDLPGLGHSIAPENFDVSLENRARFINDLLDALKIDEPINLVVHDVGGHYGLAWAVQHPERVRAIAIFSTSFFPNYPWHIGAKIWRTPILGEISLATTPPALMKKVVRASSPSLSDAYFEQIQTMSYGNPSVRRMILKHYRSIDPQKHFVGWEEKLLALNKQIPSAVFWGDKDPFIAPHFAERFGAQQVVHFPQNGHWLPIESPTEIADHLLKLFA